MKIIFGGKFENAMVRSIDAILIPDRNASLHQYYMGLNRKVAKNYLDRCGTFIAIADEILVPGIDWNYPIDGKYRGELEDSNLGIESTSAGGREWDSDTEAFVKFVLTKDVLSARSKAHITILATEHYSSEQQKQIVQKQESFSEFVASHYLNRLFLQMRAAREAEAFLVLSEEDLLIVKEIGEFAISSKLPTPFDIPDLTGKVIEPDAFCDGVLNFAPPDIRAVAAVRGDKSVREYASKIASLLEQPATEDTQRKILGAMQEAFTKIDIGQRVEKVFEVMSWVVKPLHYVPIIGEVVGAAEDAKDLFLTWEKREKTQQEWCLLGVRMTDVAIRDYLRRKSNLA